MGDSTIGYNRGATRWLGIWIDSRLNFRENAQDQRKQGKKGGDETVLVCETK